MSIQVVKRKITGFLKPPNLVIVKQAVLDVSRIISKASTLVRAYYLKEYDKNPNNIITLNHEIFTFACTIVQGQKIQTRKFSESRKEGNLLKKAERAKDKAVKDTEAAKTEENKSTKEKDEAKKVKRKKKTNPKKTEEENYKEKQDLKEYVAPRLQEIFLDIYGQEGVENSDYSLSHILGYSINNLLTAYGNNITQHFQKYPKRYITYQLMLEDNSLKRKEANKLAAKVVGHMMFNEPILQDDQVTLGLANRFTNLFPPKIDKEYEEDKEGVVYEDNTSLRILDLYEQPWLYLNKMVEIKKLVETLQNNLQIAGDEELLKRLRIKSYNPLPFHSSNVPMHIRLDTSGIVQLLMNKEKIEAFKTSYEASHLDKLNISSKADILSSFEKIFGRKPNDRMEEGLFATSIWSELTNLEQKKIQSTVAPIIKGEVWMFDNAVVTDGISISFQITKASVFGRKGFSRSGAKKERKDEKTKKEEELETQKLKIAELKERFDTTKVLSCDPGKHDLLAISDGIKTLFYTIKQRNLHTKKIAREKFTLERRREMGLETFETTILNQFPKSSCFYDTFKQYCKTKNESKQLFIDCYNHEAFRQFKFLTFVKTRSSEMKFMSKIKKEFKRPDTRSPTCVSVEMRLNAMKQTTDFTIGWGNWGKNPNALKGTAPTPGIGLRRRFESFFKTITVCEHNTSQDCPCCKIKGLKPFEKMIENQKIHKHHLLRCTNDQCYSRWWNRNVVGSYNILQRFLKEIIT